MTMIHDDLHARLESVPELASIELQRTRMGPDWRCQLWTAGSDEYGEGTGPTIAEAIEGALDDMAMQRS